MAKATYARMLLNEFSNMKKEYNYVDYLTKLEEDRNGELSLLSEEEAKTSILNREHHLVRFIKQTALEVMNMQGELKSNSGNFIDDPILGNKPRFKNDIMTLRIFISKLETEGYKKELRVS